MALTERQ